ncbi:MAG TPA: hypothetical protein VHF22_02405, partial [Planctomycetota bacterium]|nr:hypothetical protein [Planctomycetota bacterium]
AAGWAFDAPVLLTFESHPRGAARSSAGLTFRFAGAAGAVQAMPLEGLRRRPTAETAAWDASGLPAEVATRCRMLVPLLAAFPTGCAEDFAVDRAKGIVTITDRYVFSDISDAWGTRPVHAAPVPPAVYRAGTQGYPVAYPAAAPVETWVATWFGPFAYIAGDAATYTLPLPAGLERLPVPLLVKNDATAATVRAELLRLIRDEAPAQPASAFLDNDDRHAATLAEAFATLAKGSPERAKALEVAPRLAEHGWLDDSLQTCVEPVTGQSFLCAAKWWAAAEPFDKEWDAGRQLAALAHVAEAIDLDVARGVWAKARALYRYDRIFFDWATGSVTSSTYGYTELCDGIHFAWEGMLGVGRLARRLGDDLIARDAAYRAARQQAALYAAWFQAAWVRDLDYAVGHISDARLAPADVETRGAVDGFVEDFGCSTLEFKSFWQTTNYVFYDNVPQLSLYRDFGLEPRLRAIEYDAMPKLHPGWTDAEALDPVDGKYYGTELTAAHLAARALLFHDAPADLFSVYTSTAGKTGSQQWYTMHRFQISGSLLLAIERARAPLVEAPVGAATVTAASWDARKDAVTLELAPFATGRATVRVRWPGQPFREVAVVLAAGKSKTVTIRK